ncbi:MAG: hypothetical protein JEY96_03855 [Bacteroidales bacterium]|nr:hypothetical protein [Bacteroidales bacterium]
MEFPIIFILIVAVIVIIVLFNSFTKKAIVKRKLRKTPSKKISDFKNGNIAKVVGRVDCVNSPLLAPLSNRKCAYYSIKVEKRVSTGKNSHWEKIIEEDVYDTFIVRDSTGTALINTDNIKSYLVVDAKYKSGLFDDATVRLETYLSKHGHQSVGFLGLNKTIRYREAVLELGEQLAVAGSGQWIEKSELLPNEKVLEITSYEQVPVFLSDDTSTLEFVPEKKPSLETKRGFHKPERKEKGVKQKKRERYSKSYK